MNWQDEDMVWVKDFDGKRYYVPASSYKNTLYHLGLRLDGFTKADNDKYKHIGAKSRKKKEFLAEKKEALESGTFNHFNHLTGKYENLSSFPNPTVNSPTLQENNTLNPNWKYYKPSEEYNMPGRGTGPVFTAKNKGPTNSLLKGAQGDVLRSGTFDRDPRTFKDSEMGSLKRFADMQRNLQSGTFDRDPSTFKDSNMNSLLNASRGDLLRSGTFDRDPSTFKDSNMNSLLNASRGDLLRSGTFDRDPSTFKDSNMNSLLNASRGDLLRSGTFSRDPRTFKDSEMGSLGNAAHEDLLRSGGWQYNNNALGPDTNAILNKPYNPLPQTEQTQNYTPWQSLMDIGSGAKDALSEGYNLFKGNVQDYRKDRSFPSQSIPPLPSIFDATEYVTDNLAGPVKNFFGDAFQGVSDAWNKPYNPAINWDDMSNRWDELTDWMGGGESKAAAMEKAKLDKYLKDAEYRYVNIHGVAFDEDARKEVIAQFHRDKRLGKL
jgi:hypothetical protein